MLVPVEVGQAQWDLIGRLEASMESRILRCSFHQLTKLLPTSNEGLCGEARSLFRGILQGFGRAARADAPDGSISKTEDDIGVIKEMGSRWRGLLAQL